MFPEAAWVFFHTSKYFVPQIQQSVACTLVNFSFPPPPLPIVHCPARPLYQSYIASAIKTIMLMLIILCDLAQLDLKIHNLKQKFTFFSLFSTDTLMYLPKLLFHIYFAQKSKIILQNCRHFFVALKAQSAQNVQDSHEFLLYLGYITLIHTPPVPFLVQHFNHVCFCMSELPTD